MSQIGRLRFCLNCFAPSLAAQKHGAPLRKPECWDYKPRTGQGSESYGKRFIHDLEHAYVLGSACSHPVRLIPHGEKNSERVCGLTVSQRFWPVMPTRTISKCFGQKYCLISWVKSAVSDFAL